MMDKEKGTAPVSSVGADAKQPPIKSHTKSIADLPEQGNLQATNNESLHAISMTELYDTAYPPKLPIIDGLLYNGTYLFVGAPKLVSPFLWHRLDITSAWAFRYGGIQCDGGQFFIWHWKMITQDSRNGCRACLVWKEARSFILLQDQKH